MSTDIPVSSQEVALDHQQQQEEGVLRDVLDELDKERSKRAELEAQLKALREERPSKPPEESEEAISRRAFRAMEAEARGYKEIVDAVTIGKRAIAVAAAASKGTSSVRTLPLHVVRLLEVMPWDPRATQHIFAIQMLFEWQYHDNGIWQAGLKHLPMLFRSLPIVRPKEQPDERKDSKGDRNNLLVFLAGGERGPAPPSKHGVLTDERLSCVFNIENGYPLPADGGTWEWVGGWRVDKRTNLDSDEQGWSYAQDPQHYRLMPTDWVWDNPGANNERRIRRRQWSRQRVLVDYPYAAERTRQYLKLLAENAKLAIVTNKISDQLVETKTSLTVTEERLLQATTEAHGTISLLQAELRHKNDLLRTAGVNIETSMEAPEKKEEASTNSLQDFLSNNEQVRDISSKITKWVHSASRRSSGDLEGGKEAGATPRGPELVHGSPKPFDWRKVGRGAVLEKIQHNQNYQKRADQGSSNSIQTVESAETEEGSPPAAAVTEFSSTTDSRSPSLLASASKKDISSVTLDPLVPLPGEDHPEVSTSTPGPQYMAQGEG